MRVKPRDLLAFVPAILGAYVVGAILITQVNLAELESLGVRITLRDRLHATGHDLIGLGMQYLPAIGGAFLVAFPLAAFMARWMPQARLALYLTAGGSALIVLHLVARAVLGLHGIAAVREFHGLFLQAIAGGLGAYIYFVATGWAHRSDPSSAAPPRA